MADTPKLRLYQIEGQSQIRDMRRLELGEAWANEDYDRAREINDEMRKQGDRPSDIRYENERSRGDFDQFERREERQNAEPPMEPARAARPEHEASPLKDCGVDRPEDGPIIHAGVPSQPSGVNRAPGTYGDLERDYAAMMNGPEPAALEPERAPQVDPTAEDSLRFHGEPGQAREREQEKAEELTFHSELHPSRTRDFEH